MFGSAMLPLHECYLFCRDSAEAVYNLHSQIESRIYYYIFRKHTTAYKMLNIHLLLPQLLLIVTTEILLDDSVPNYLKLILLELKLKIKSLIGNTKKHV